MNDLMIDAELHHFFRPLTPAEFAALEASVLQEGMTEPLYVWKERHVLLDGHHRYQICHTHQLPYVTVEVALDDHDAAKLWMIKHQQARRNWTNEEFHYYIGIRYQLEKKQGTRTDLTSGHNDQKSSDERETRGRLATEYRVAAKTVQRSADYARDIDTIASVSPGAKEALLSRETKLVREEVKALADLAQARPETATHVLDAVKQAPTRKAAQQVVREAVRVYKGLAQEPIDQALPVQPTSRPTPAPAPPPAGLVSLMSNVLDSFEALTTWLDTQSPRAVLAEHPALGVRLGTHCRNMLCLLIDAGLAVVTAPPTSPRSAPTPKAKPKGKAKAKKKRSGTLRARVIRVIQQCGPVTCAAIATQLKAENRAVWNALEALEKQGKLQKDATTKLYHSIAT